MANCKVCHIEYRSEDLAASQAFGEKAFGWVFRSFGDSMVIFGTADGHIGGFSKGAKPSGKGNPEVSYKVENLDQFLAEAQSHGATVGDSRREVPGVGFYASIFAPDGNEFGLVEFTE